MDSALDLFSPATRQWFLETIGQPTAVQREGWPVIAAGGNALISAPTGTGKTLTAFLWFIDRLNALNKAGRLKSQLYVIYISPLKSLGNDVRENLRRPLDGLGSPLRAAIRNGDTTARERRAMIKRPPHILLTTPESLYLMLTSQSGRNILSSARAVIIDELHAMINTKRGAHLMLSLERLDALCGGEVQRVGLSATIRPLDRAAQYLSGEGRAADAVAPFIEKEVDVTVRAAAPDMRVLPERSIWPEICREIYEASLAARTVLVFCQGRATAEKVALGVNTIAGQECYARTHHGSVSKEQRLEAEAELRSGLLHVLCATSSMELGIDVGEVDLVMQIGVPQMVSSAVQRLGRAGHRPGAVSVMRFYPRTQQDLILASLCAQSVREKAIEEVKPPRACLDILAQHLVSMAAAQEYDAADAYGLVKKCYCFSDLSFERFESALRMLAGDYEHAQDKPATPRIHYDRVNGHIIGNRLSGMLAVSSGGTIPDRGLYMVVLEDNITRLGELDEEFVFEARLGDKFMLGAFSWQIMAIKRDRVVVRPSNTAGAQAPFWKGDGMNRPYETGLRYGRMLDNLNQAYAAGKLAHEFAKLTEDADAAMNAARYLSEQIEAVGCLASHRVIVEERFKNETGEHLMMVHSVFGGLVNRALGMLLKDAVEQVTGGDARLWHDDDGVLIHLLGGGEIPENALGLLDERALKSRLAALMPATPMFSMAFRYNAARALMMGVRPGGRVPLWVQRIRAAESYAQATDFPGHPLLIETMRECMEEQLDIDAAREVLTGIKSGAIRVVKKRMIRPSPMTIVLRQALELEMMYEYHPAPSSAAGLTVADDEARLTIEPDRRFVDSVTENVKPPADREQLHDRLMIEGDMEAGEVNAPGEWLEWLAARGRALYIEPGLWIAAEQQMLYESALEGAPPENTEDMARVARRCLRFRGPMDAESLAERYMWGAEDARRALDRLIADGAIIESDGVYIHRDVYEQAQRMTLSARRREVATAPPERYAALLADWQSHAGGQSEQLEAGISQLAGLSMPADLWENVILPARTQNYRPKMLDDLLGQGRFVWRLTPGDRPMVCFDLPGDVDWDADAGSPEASGQARDIASLLARRGASFAHAISSGLGGAPVAAALQDLVESGAARCDSFAPLRRREGASSARQRVQMRNAAQDAGRWELTRPAKALSMREIIARAFGRWAILCRETAAPEGIDWRTALQTLRVMEYAGEIRRGYFVKGLSGAQFVLKGDFNRVIAALSASAAHEDDCACLCAVDPAQAWGRILPLPEGVSFICVPGTAVITMHGAPALILERQGAALRVIIDDQAPFNAMAAAFRQGKIYPHLRSMTIKQYPIAAKERLEQCGFTREMRDYVMWK